MLRCRVLRGPVFHGIIVLLPFLLSPPGGAQGMSFTGDAAAPEAWHRGIDFGADGSMMRRVVGGKWVKGSPGGATETVEVASFDMDTHEVTVESYLRFCAVTGRRPPEGMPRLSPALPAQVGWKDATEYARHYGERLPSPLEVEWVLRSGKSAGTFPWGDGSSPPREYANLAGSETSLLPGVLERIPGYSDHHPALAPVGSYLPDACGLYDVCGNAWEWTNEARLVPEWSLTRKMVVLTGGGWDAPLTYLRTDSRSLGAEDGERGFRCVREVPGGK